MSTIMNNFNNIKVYNLLPKNRQEVDNKKCIIGEDIGLNLSNVSDHFVSMEDILSLAKNKIFGTY